MSQEVNSEEFDVATDWQQVKNVLVIRLDSLGDVLMTTPAIRALHDSLPGSRVTLLTSKSGSVVAPYIPEIDEVILYEAPWMKATSSRESSQPDFEMIERLRGGHFDAAVIFTVYSQNPLPAAFLCFLAGIPIRLAYCRENPYQLLTHWVKEQEPETQILHEVQRHLDLVAKVGSTTSNPHLSFQPSDQDRQRVADLLVEKGINLHAPWIAIHPGATAPSRRYPPQLFAEVARGLANKNLQILFSGSLEERELISSIQASMGNTQSISVAGDLSLGELGALLEAAHLLISNNTGPVHIAAAVGTPVVDLYALTNPQHTPWAVSSIVLSHDVPCRFCYKSICPQIHHNCLRLIEPAWVIQAAETLLAGKGEGEFLENHPGLPLFREFPGREETKPEGIHSI